jgi:hypothetical protein
MVYVLSLIWVLQKLHFWNTSLVKDSLYWFFGVSLVLFFRITKAKNLTFFKDAIRDTFKWTIAIEFLLNFYVFSLPVELVLITVLLFLSIFQASAQTDIKYAQVGRFLKGVTGLIGLSIFAIVCYKTITSSEVLLKVENLNSFLLPLILTIFFASFLYLIALYIAYESLFNRLNALINDSKLLTSLKWRILKAANINLNKLEKINADINKPLFLNEGTLEGFLKN